MAAEMHARIFCIALAAGVTAAAAQTPPAGPPAAPPPSARESTVLAVADANFVKQALQDGLVEVELGRLAATKASTPAVREFAQHMVADHSKANGELAELAQQLGLQLAPSPSTEQAKLREQLDQLSGDAFDRAYMESQVKDHLKAVQLFERHSTAGGDKEVRAYAAAKLPVLQQHLEQAKRVSGVVGKQAGRPSTAA
ncbi:MAG: DUF4142 domain-containing protein [Alphaproteobacteria bacterium]|nr:DUF4142 domain-containing protein [Alphaproteobacteria bacterium]